MRMLLCALMLAALGGQDAPPRHDKYASDPKAYCLPAKPMPNDSHGHECHCEFMCSPNLDGQPGGHQIENQACEEYCQLDRCACHSEQTCDDPVEPRKP